MRSIIRTSSGGGANVTMAALVLVPAVHVRCVPRFLIVQTDGCRRFRRFRRFYPRARDGRVHRRHRSAAVPPTRRRSSALFALPAVVLSPLPACTLSAFSQRCWSARVPVRCCGPSLGRGHRGAHPPLHRRLRLLLLSAAKQTLARASVWHARPPAKAHTSQTRVALDGRRP